MEHMEEKVNQDRSGGGGNPRGSCSETSAGGLEFRKVSEDVPAWLWLWIPLILAVLPYLTFLASRDFHARWIRHETGLIETATALFLMGALWYAVRLTSSVKNLPRRWMRIWFGVLAFGTLFFLGEEISWGQHWFGWSTPAGLAELNEQGETNLHNIGGWTEALLDQGPRSLLTLAALVAGVIVPLFVRDKRAWGVSGVQAWLWPTRACVPACVLALTIRLPKKFLRSVDMDAPEIWQVHGGESKELFLALFLLIYFRVNYVRSCSKKALAECDEWQTDQQVSATS